MTKLLTLSILLLLAACATGVQQLTDEESIVCRDQGCAAFTLIELQTLVGRAYRDGYQRGWTDAHRQAGRSL